MVYFILIPVIFFRHSLIIVSVYLCFNFEKMLLHLEKVSQPLQLYFCPRSYIPEKYSGWENHLDKMKFCWRVRRLREK